MTNQKSSIKLTELCEKWQLTDLHLLGEDSPRNNYVARAYSDMYQEEVVLKILLTDTDELNYLSMHQGNSCVKMLNCDRERKAFLLELVKPGISLKTFFHEQDVEATVIVAHIIKKLSLQSSFKYRDQFESVTNWLTLLDSFKSTKIPRKYLERAQFLAKKLTSNTQNFSLLHADLHSKNILLRTDHNKQEWIVIDPKGVFGPLEYEIGRFLMNPMPDLLAQKNPKDIIEQRIILFCELLDLKKETVIDWAYVQAILSACWSEEDGDTIFLQHVISFTEIIEQILE